MDDDNYSWPGWGLQDNPFGAEFDLGARKRMVRNSRLLLPIIRKYSLSLGESIVEAGPFFNPLLTPEEFPAQKIVYLDNDPYVILHLSKKYPSVEVKKVDLEDFEHSIINQAVDSVVISHILNYIDYKKFFSEIRKIIKPGGYVFINHSVDYGLPFFFSDHRPKSIAVLLDELSKNRFEIQEQKIIPTKNKEHQPFERILLVLRKN